MNESENVILKNIFALQKMWNTSNADKMQCSVVELSD